MVLTHKTAAGQCGSPAAPSARAEVIAARRAARRATGAGLNAPGPAAALSGPPDPLALRPRAAVVTYLIVETGDVHKEIPQA